MSMSESVARSENKSQDSDDSSVLPMNKTLGRRHNKEIDSRIDSDDASGSGANEGKNDEEKSYQQIAKTVRNIDGLVSEAKDINDFKPGRVKKVDGYSDTAAERTNQNMEFLFPTGK